jgi:hypothetical protein
MFNFVKNIDTKTIIIFGLVIVIFLLHMCSTDVSNDGKTVKIGGRTYTVIKHEVDTIKVPVKQIVYKKGEDIYHEKIVFVENKIDQIDTDKVVTDYYSQLIYKDTLKLKDSLGYITITDTISNNTLVNRKWESYVNKFIVKDITILKETPKNQFFIGGFSGYNSKLNSLYLGPTIMLKNKKENTINLGVAVGTGKEVLVQGSIYRIIKFNK